MENGLAELKAFDDFVPRAICVKCKDIMSFPNQKIGVQMLREMKWRCMKCEIFSEKPTPQALRKKMDAKNEKTVK